MNASRLEDVPKEFPSLAGGVYMNASAQGPLPLRSHRVALDMLDRMRNPALYRLKEHFDVPRRARAAAARLLGVPVEAVSLAPGASYGVNAAAQGLPLRAGNEALLVKGNFPSNVYPWLNLEKRGVSVRFMERPRDVLCAEDVERALSAKTRVFAFDWVQFSTGVRAEAEKIVPMLRERGIFSVADAAQGLGGLAWRGALPDVLVCPGHKWLLAPVGTGFMYVAPETRERMASSCIGWMAFLKTDDFGSLTDYDFALPADGRRYEAGSPALDHLAAFTESAEWLAGIGLENVEAYVKGIEAPLLAWLHERGFDVSGGRDMDNRSLIVSFAAPDGRDLTETYRGLLKEGVVCSLREGRIRLSPHLYNTAEDAEKTLVALQKFFP